MDDLLSEFLTETSESLDVVDVELVKFEQDPNNAKILDNIFRLVHTIKGTCGFLGLPRLEAIAHAAETLMGKFRDGAKVTPSAVSLTLVSIDRIKELLGELEATGQEPEGSDEDVISQLEEMAARAFDASDDDAPAEEAPAAKKDDDEPPLVVQDLKRELKPGEVTLDDLERAFREAPGPEDLAAEETPVEEVVAEAEPEAEPVAVADEADDEDDAPVVAAAAKPKKPMRAAKGDDYEGQKANQPVATTQSIRVNVDTLENLMTMVSELVLTRNQLLEISRRHEDSEFKVPLQRLSNVTAELQEGVMKTRMQPIGNAWQKLPRIVRDLAQELKKNIELEMHGADTELDRQVLEMIKDPLTHMVRNSADHGLETPAEREAAGKPGKGTIKLSAYHEGGHIIIEIADNGRGLNTDRIRQKAVENGLATEAELDKMTEVQINKFIFAAGFSTAAAITNVSGRGVGMDVVRNNIELIGGSIDLKSVQGRGSTFMIKIPLTLAIVSALIVESGGHRFAIPQLSVVELVRAHNNSDHKIESIKNTPVLRLRNKLLPLVHLKKMLGIDENAHIDEHSEDGFIVVTQVGSQTFGIVVDGVFHTEEIVVKPMSSMLRDITMFSGTTILGDGSVIMIIDPNGIAQSTGGEVAAAAEETKETTHKQTSEEMISFLVFRAVTEEPKAIPLSLVTRLEEVEIKDIEYSNGRHLVQYRGKLMPLIGMTPDTKPKTEGRQQMLVFADDGRSMGLMVDEIIDIIEDYMDIEIGSERKGILGSAVIKGRATEIIDIGYFLPIAFKDWFERKDQEGRMITPSVLFLDDSPFFRNMFTPVLQSAGYKVTTVSNGKEALVLLQNRKFDAIISDLEMPEMDGFTFVQAVRTNPKTAKIPCVALSSHTAPEAIERGRRVGFDDFVAKFDREGLVASLSDCLTQVGAAA